MLWFPVPLLYLVLLKITSQEVSEVRLNNNIICTTGFFVVSKTSGLMQSIYGLDIYLDLILAERMAQVFCNYCSDYIKFLAVKVICHCLPFQNCHYCSSLKIAKMPVFRVTNHDRSHKVLVVAESIKEVLQTASKKLNVPPESPATRIYLEDENIQVDEDAILLSLPETMTTLMVCSDKENWCSPPSRHEPPSSNHQDILHKVVPTEQAEPHPSDSYSEEATDQREAEMAGPSRRVSEGTASQTVSVALKPWRKPYMLPLKDMSEDVVTKLNNRMYIQEPDRKKLLGPLYQDITKFTFYPSPSQYEDVIRAMFTMWPHLSTEAGLEAADAQTLWKRRLRDKFINTRRRRDRNQQCVIQRKLKRKGQDKEEDSSSHRAMFGVANYLPERPPGEDDTSIQAHITWMKDLKAARPKKPDYAKISLLMDRTLADRRRRIVTECVAVCDLLEDFPWLQDEDEMLAEYERLTRQSLTTQLNTFLEGYGCILIQMVNGLKKKPKALDFLVNQYLQQNTECERREAMAGAAFISLQVLLKEDPGFFLSSTQPADVPVHVLCDGFDGPYDIICEGVPLCQTESMEAAIKVYLSTFFVFNLVYPLKLTKTLMFCEKMILNIGDISKKPKKIREWYKTVIALVAKMNEKKKQ